MSWIGIYDGIFTLFCMSVFVAVVAWAWNGRQKQSFDEAARLPLEDDEPAPVVRENRQ
ncbi:MAG TPA: cbb3-type cytochrome c oxidase subunit 3 [Chromatiales bacterium]|nr:cbb3-type cytochrome c oxidase subunit 3 [Chromatiales bacterium]